MPDRLSKVAEVLANLAIVVVAGAIVVSLYGNYTAKKKDEVLIKPGDPIALAGLVDTSHPTAHLVLALSTTCHFCNDSAPFYQRLVAATSGQQQVGMTAVFPQPRDEAAAHLQQLGLKIDDIRQANLASLHVSGTPTLILTDSRGRVEKVWLGRLTPERETEVLMSLGQRSTSGNN